MWSFFYHYRRATGDMSVHFRGQCIPCRNVECRVPCATHRQKRQPPLVMKGKAHNVSVKDGVAVIS